MPTTILTEVQAGKLIQDSKWSVKKVKTMRGHDGDAMSCSLYLDGKEVCEIYDDSWGGEYMYHWKEGKRFENELREFAKTIWTESDLFPDGFQYNSDMVVNALACTILEEKDAKREENRLKRMCKTKVVFLLKSKPDDMLSYKRTNPAIIKEQIAFVKRKHGDDLIEVINERFM